MYEEKTSAEIAAQVGLTENATNQLIFRARSAFKKALLGDDVDTTGMSVSKILSVAARKAAFEAKKVGAQAMVFVLFLILGIGAVVNFTSRPNNQIQAGPAQSPSSQTPSTASSQAPTAGSIAPVPSQTSEVVQNPSIGNLAIGVSQADPSLTPAPMASAPPTVLASSELIEYAARAASVVATHASQIQDEIYLSADKRQVISVKGSPLSAKFEYSLESASISSLIITFELDGQTYKTYPYSYSVSKNGLGSVSAIGQLGYFIDSKSRVVTENPLQSARFELILQLDGSGKAVNAELKLTN
jgi:RNA polymerase sigma-70 factor (ECF subfamily)